MVAHSRLAVLTAVTGTSSVGALRLSYDRGQQSLLLKKAAKLELLHTADVVKLDPAENEHSNPFFARDWWPHPDDPNKKEDDDPEKAELKETEDANTEALNSDGLAVQASYQAEASKKSAEKDSLDKEKKKKAEEEEKKAEDAKKAADAARKKAEETKKTALKVLEENHKQKITELTSFKQKELAKCDTDLTNARHQYNRDANWFNAARRQAAEHFRATVRRAHWIKRLFVYIRQRGVYQRKMAQLNQQFIVKQARWTNAAQAYRKCRAQQRQFDWQIKQAKAKYEQARGVPGRKLLGCFQDKPQRSMTKIRGRFSIKRCAKKCGVRGYETMAIQYSWECFCGRGNQHEKYGKKPDSDCSRTCTQDPEERRDPKLKCGGVWRSSVYKLA